MLKLLFLLMLCGLALGGLPKTATSTPTRTTVVRIVVLHGDVTRIDRGRIVWDRLMGSFSVNSRGKVCHTDSVTAELEGKPWAVVQPLLRTQGWVLSILEVR